MTVQALLLVKLPSSDSRRDLYEADTPNGDRVTQLVITEEHIAACTDGEAILGNHYHLNGVERFFLASGENVELHTQDTNVEDAPAEAQVFNAPATIDMPTGVRTRISPSF